jgi:hypothetical protein
MSTLRTKAVITFVGICLSLPTLVGCSRSLPRSASTTSARSTTPTRESTKEIALPPVVDGVPVLSLAKRALQESTEWGVQDPTDVRAILSGDVYVVALRGRFFCSPPRCSTSAPVSETLVTPRSGPVGVSYMKFSVQIPSRPPASMSLSVGRFNADLARLGRVYDLQAYVTRLSHGSLGQ